MYHTYNIRKKIIEKNKNFFVIQNSLRIINSVKYIQQKKQMMSFLSINLQIFSFKIHKMHIKKMKKVVSEIVEKAKVQYAYSQYNKLWNKVNPYFYRLLTVIKHKTKKNEARKIVMRNNYESIMSIFQYHLFIYKINKKKKATYYLQNFAVTKFMSSYYKKMIENIKIIQKYMNTFLNKNKVLDKKNQNLNYLSNNSTSDFNDDVIENKNKKNINSSNKNTIDNNNHSIYNKTIETEVEKTIESLMTSKKWENTYINTLSNDNKKIKIGDRNKKNKYINNFDNTKTIDKSYISYNKSLINEYLYQKNKTKDDDKYENKEHDYLKNILPPYYNFNQPIIRVFAKILEIDYLYKNDDLDEKLWNEEFCKIYKDSIKNETPIQKIEISNTHTMVLNSSGKVYSWGWNNFGQCGSFPNLTKQSYLFPNIFFNNKNKNNSNKEFPSLPNLHYKYNEKSLPIQNVADISITEDFSIIITRKGNAILFGDNSYGQLGKGHRINVNSAQILEKFKNKIKTIKSSENMNLILTKNNNLYKWDICSNEFLIHPSLIYLPRKTKIESISTGKNFSILLSSNGICFGLGSNLLGELGLEEKAFYDIPEEIIYLSQFNERIIQVRCGFKHTVCISRSGKVYTWGNNTYGQLGHKNNGNIYPDLITIEEKNERVKIIQVSAGFRASFFLSNKGSIYYTGILNEKEKSFVPKIYALDENKGEISDDKKFLPVKIWSSFARNKSIFYATFADVRCLVNKFINRERIKDIVFTLAEKWLSDEITAPFIPHIQKYFESHFMKI